MPPDDPLARHRVELRARFAVFALFDALDAAGLSTEVLRAVRAEGARIAELAIAHEIPGAPAEPCSRTLAAGPPDGVVPRFAAWRATLAAAAPDRPGMVLVLGHFANWLALAPAHETVVCRSLPAIGPVVSELGTEGITDILSVLRDVSDPGAILDVSGAYGSTDGPTVRALVRVGALTRDWDGPSVLQRLREAIPPERTDESRDAERVIPAVGALIVASAAHGDAHARAAADLALTLAEKDLSSAFAATHALRTPIEHADRSTALAWLEDSALLARTVGTRAVRFCLRELPELYRRHGVDPTRAFVRATADVAEAYGTTAAQWFYERRTAAARSFLQS